MGIDATTPPIETLKAEYIRLMTRYNERFYGAPGNRTDDEEMDRITADSHAILAEIEKVEPGWRPHHADLIGDFERTVAEARETDPTATSMAAALDRYFARTFPGQEVPGYYEMALMVQERVGTRERRCSFREAAEAVLAVREAGALAAAVEILMVPGQYQWADGTVATEVAKLTCYDFTTAAEAVLTARREMRVIGPKARPEQPTSTSKTVCVVRPGKDGIEVWSMAVRHAFGFKTQAEGEGWAESNGYQICPIADAADAKPADVDLAMQEAARSSRGCQRRIGTLAALVDYQASRDSSKPPDPEPSAEEIAAFLAPTDTTDWDECPVCGDMQPPAHVCEERVNEGEDPELARMQRLVDDGHFESVRVVEPSEDLTERRELELMGSMRCGAQDARLEELRTEAADKAIEEHGAIKVHATRLLDVPPGLQPKEGGQDR
jgi:hypothetical protein